VVPGKNPRGDTVYWVGARGLPRAKPGRAPISTRSSTVRCSVTPLQVDLTHASQIPMVSEWMAR
jgi:5'-nucleotidase